MNYMKRLKIFNIFNNNITSTSGDIGNNVNASDSISNGEYELVNIDSNSNSITVPLME